MVVVVEELLSWVLVSGSIVSFEAVEGVPSVEVAEDEGDDGASSVAEV